MIHDRRLRRGAVPLLVLFCYSLTTPSPSAFAQGQKQSPQLALQTAHYGNVAAAAFSPNTQIIATGGDDWNVKLWNPNTGEVIRTLVGHIAGVRAVAFSSDGRLLASGSDDSTVKLWDPKTGKLLHSFDDPDRYGVTTISFSLDNKLLASAGGTGAAFLGKIRLWDLVKHTFKLAINEDSDGVIGLDFSPNSALLMSGGKDGKLKIWDATTGELKRQWEAHATGITSFSSASNWLMVATGSDDGTVKLWDPNTSQLLRTIEVNKDDPTSVAFSGDNKSLVVGNTEVSVYDPATGALQRILAKKTLNSKGVLVSPDGKTAANIGVSDLPNAPSTEVSLWQLQTGDFQRRLQGYMEGLVSVLYAPDNNTLITGDSEKRVAFWNVRTGELQRVLLQSETIKSLAISTNGKTLAVSGGDFGQPGSVALWDVQTGSLQRKLVGHLLPVRASMFSRAGNRLLSGSEDGTLKLWDVQSGQEERTIKNSSLPVLSVTFLPDGHSLAAGSHDGKVTIWDGDSGTLVNTVKGQTSGVFTLALSPDGRTLAAAGPNTSAISLWDIVTWKLKTTLRHTLLSPTSISFIGNSRLAASNANGRVNLWNIADGKLVRELTVHDLGGSSIALSPENRYLASAAHDGSVRLLNLKRNNLAAILYSPRTDELPDVGSATPAQPVPVAEFFVITRKGFYLATPRAELAMRLSLGTNAFPAKHFHSKYYRPKQVRKALHE